MVVVAGLPVAVVVRVLPCVCVRVHVGRIFWDLIVRVCLVTVVVALQRWVESKSNKNIENRHLFEKQTRVAVGGARARWGCAM